MLAVSLGNVPGGRGPTIRRVLAAETRRDASVTFQRLRGGFQYVDLSSFSSSSFLPLLHLVSVSLTCAARCFTARIRPISITYIPSALSSPHQSRNKAAHDYHMPTHTHTHTHTHTLHSAIPPLSNVHHHLCLPPSALMLPHKKPIISAPADGNVYSAASSLLRLPPSDLTSPALLLCLPPLIQLMMAAHLVKELVIKERTPSV